MSTTSGNPAQPATSADEPSIGQTAVRGMVWMAGQTAVSRVVSLFAQVVLGWLLLEEHFGLSRMASSIVVLAAVLTSPGIDEVLVRRHRRQERWLTPAFWMSGAAGLLGAALMLASAPLGAWYYDARQVMGMVAVLAIGAPLNAIAQVPMAKLRGELRFRAVAAINAFEVISLQLMMLLFAWLGFREYSFVLPAPIVAAVRAAVLWWWARPKIRWQPQFGRWRYLVGDGAAVLATRVTLTVVTMADALVLGVLANQAVVGLYFFAWTLCSQPVRLAAGAISAALFPALSRLQGEPARHAAATMRAVRLLTAVAFPLCLLPAALAEPLFHGLLAERWWPAVPIVRVLSLGLAFDAASWLIFPVLYSRGQFNRGLWVMLIIAPVYFGAVIVGALVGGALGVATALLVYYAGAGPVMVHLVLRDAGARPADTVMMYLRPLALSVFSVGCAWGVTLLFPAGRAGSVAALVVAGMVGLAVHAVVMRLFTRDDWDELLARLRPRLRGAAA